jgi:hypothetical protein
MPRYELVLHVTQELPCSTAEEAAALVRRQLGAYGAPAPQLLHLAVWRQDPAPRPSPLPDPVRQHLLTFFTALEACAADAEDAFRAEVAAILARGQLREAEVRQALEQDES